MEDKIKDNDKTSSDIRRKKRRKRTSSSKTQHSSKKKDTVKNKKFNKIFLFSTVAIIGVLGIYFFHKKDSNIEVVKHSAEQSIPQNQTNIIKFEELNTDQKNEIIAQKFNSNPLLEGWNNEEVQSLKSYIYKYSINKGFSEKASHKDVGIFSLMNSKDQYSDVLNEKEILSEKTGYPYINTTGLVINEKGFVTSILLDSPAYLSGIRKNWQLFNVNNYNKPFFSNNYKTNDLLLSKSSSVWRNPNNQYFNLNPIQTYPAIGALANGIVQNHILNLQIEEITKATPGRIYSIIQNTLRTEKITGILIDLRTPADTINGIQEMAWILNGGNENVIATATNNKNETFQILAKKPTFNMDDNIINIIKNTKKIIVVNKETKGLSEALAYNIQKSNASLFGESTFGKNTIESNFIVGNKGVKVSTYNFTLPENKALPLKPASTINFSALNQLYNIQQY